MSLNRLPAQLSGSGAPTSVAGQVSDQYHDTTVTGSLYICTTAGNPGTWQQVSGGGGSTFVGYPSYSINLDSQPSGTYTIPNNLPAEIKFTTTGLGATSVSLPNYTMETQHTYLPLTVINSASSTVKFNFNGSDFYPGQSIFIFPTDYTMDDGSVIITNGYPISRSSRVNSADLTISSSDNNYLIYQFRNSSSTLNINLPNTINLPENFTLDIILTGIGSGSYGDYTFFPYGSDTIAGNNGLEQTFSHGEGVYFLQLTYGNTNSLTTWIYNFINYESTSVVEAANDTIVVTNPSSGVYSVAGGYVAGANITITGNSIASTGGSSTTVEATNDTIVVTNPSSGVYSVAGGYVGGSGISVTTNSISSNLNSITTNIFQSEGSITILDSYGQNLLLGVVASGFSVSMPDPTSNNPLQKLYPYTITIQQTNGMSISSPLALLNSDDSPVLDISGNPVIMQPGDTWSCFYTGATNKCLAYLISNSINVSNSIAVLGKWFALTTDLTVNDYENYMSTQIVSFNGGSYISYTIPGYWTTLTTVTSNQFVFKNVDGSDFPSEILPTACSWQSTGVSGEDPVQLLWDINPTRTGSQILVNCLTGDTLPNFTASALIPSVTINFLLTS